MVISRATSDCHSFADPISIATPPLVTAARNVMIATTAASALAAIESLGTIWTWPSVSRPGRCGRRRNRANPLRSAAVTRLVIDMDVAVMEHKATGVVLVHEGDVVGGDDNRGAGFIQLDEQPEKALRQLRIHIAGRLIRQQELRPGDHGASDGGALLPAAGEAAEKLERARRNAEGEVAQNFGAEPVAQSDILELNHAVLRIAHPGKDHSVPYRLKHAHHRRGKRAWRAAERPLPTSPT